MSLFARSDLAYVFVGPAHGGCGAPRGHSRPVENGAPAKTWRLDCPACEDHLRHDPHWSSTVSDIPETHDEKLAREDFEKRGAKDKDAILTLALAKLAGIDPDILPASLTQMVSGAKAHVPQTVNCPAGHPNGLDARFCSQCGQPVGAPAQVVAPVAQSAPAPPLERVLAPEDPEPSAPVSAPPSLPWPSNTAMRSMKRDDLAMVAIEHHEDSSGTRADLLTRLIEAANAGRAS